MWPPDQKKREVLVHFANPDNDSRVKLQSGALSRTAVSIGILAVRLLPVARVGPKVALPLFLVLALKPVWQNVVGRLQQRPAACVRVISIRLARLGNRVGREFGTAVRQ